MIESAAGGDAAQRAAFAQRYAPMIRAYLTARWGRTTARQDMDDAVQMVFVECFKAGGVLARADRDAGSGFRAFLFGTVRNVALRCETARLRDGRNRSLDSASAGQIEDDETRLSLAFDRAWARQMMREAAALQRERAAAAGPAAVERVELLRLRFEMDKPIRDIALLWERDPVKLHRDYALARDEFKRSLLEVISFHQPGDSGRARRECEHLLRVLAGK